MGIMPFRSSRTYSSLLVLLGAMTSLCYSWALVPPHPSTASVVGVPQHAGFTPVSRRAMVHRIVAGFVGGAAVVLTARPLPAAAVVDCYADCFKNCNTIAPKNGDYCVSSCQDYCAQQDRQDGLSGSISSEQGEVGIFGGSIPGTGTVVKGQDKPPVVNLPGLDFSSESGRKLLGY
jgi:hypothetical protein